MAIYGHDYEYLRKIESASIGSCQSNAPDVWHVQAEFLLVLRTIFATAWKTLPCLHLSRLNLLSRIPKCLNRRFTVSYLACARAFIR